MDKEMKKEITDRIKLLRNKHGFTQDEMAEKVGLEYGSYVQMENGANLPSVTVLMKMSDIFNVSIDLILFGNNKKARTDIEDTDRFANFLKIVDLDGLENFKRHLDDLIYLVKTAENRKK